MTLYTDMDQDAKDAGFSVLKRAVASTGDFLDPLIESLELEGSYRLKPPCNSDAPSPHCPFYPAWPSYNKTQVPSSQTNCYCGSPLSNIAGAIMYNVDPQRFAIESLDAFQNVAETHPVHLPHIWNSCIDSTKEKCTLNVTTVSQNAYDFLDDKLDTGSTHVAATEIRMKLKSRQSIIQATTNVNASQLNYLETDPPTICKSINEKIYEIALSMAEPRRVDFYKRYGTPMVFDEDFVGAVPAGPLWIWNPLHLEAKGQGASRKMHVVSPGFVAKVDSIFSKFSALVTGFHYCKLISPALVMEWIYSDSLVDQLGLNAPSNKYRLERF